MYKPFVADIERMERTGERGHPLQAQAGQRRLRHDDARRVFIAPKHVWEPHLKSVEGKPENDRVDPRSAEVGSGPFKQVRAR